MQTQSVDMPTEQVMALLQDQLSKHDTVLVEELWQRYSSIGARQLRDGLRMLIESQRLSMRVEDHGPVLVLNQPTTD